MAGFRLFHLGVLLWGLALGLMVMPAGCSQSGQQEAQRPEIPSAYKIKANPFSPLDRKALEEGKEIYNLRCAVCHGKDGKGKGYGAQDLDVPPADLTDASKYGELTDGEWFYLISEGRPLRQMPAWRRFLGEDDIWRLILYVRRFPKLPQQKQA